MAKFSQSQKNGYIAANGFQAVGGQMMPGGRMMAVANNGQVIMANQVQIANPATLQGQFSKNIISVILWFRKTRIRL